MAAREALKATVQKVKPILSLNEADAKRRVISLYKAWYRQIPYIILNYHIPKNVEQCREKLREKFREHKDVTDIRVIDLLVIKGQMELKETAEIWKQKGHVMAYFKDTAEPKPNDFLSKFLNSNK